ncbi:MAG: gluconolactonase [Chloroflexi bacterium]|nr:gluconolactonase [Chloroflexota bacterium]|tara:strand:- start:11659 stop:12552 length:894 start_codon:yes stop_codon:yes gene_type:complete
MHNKFSKLIPNDELIKLYSGTIWAEGPAWINNLSSLVWSDVRSNKMLIYDSKIESVSTFRSPSSFNNGNCLDNLQRLISCQHENRCIVREEDNGNLTVIADNFEGKKFNSPNDVVVKSDNSIWFTDPPYGILTNEEGKKSESEIGGNYVYKVDDNGTVSKILDNFDKPNGIVFSPDEKYLYVADSGAAEPGNIDFNKPHHVKRYDLDNNGNLSNEIIFCDIEEGFPDGMTTDIDGNLFICDPYGHKIHIYESSGNFIGHINIPERVANCTFGGENNSLLYITASTSLYVLETGTIGQ